MLLRHIANGVQIASRTVFIDETVQIAPGAVILPGTILRGRAPSSGRAASSAPTPSSRQHRRRGTTVNASQSTPRRSAPHNNIGPFTHIRAGTVTDYGVHLGAYVETKNSNFARGNTVSHLTYIGDSDVGKYCNFGCGTVTCNYDGQNKYRTTIGDYCFIGCNTNLVAPVSVGRRGLHRRRQHRHPERARRALAIERGRQANVEGWAVPRMEAYIAKKQRLEAEQRQAEQSEQG